MEFLIMGIVVFIIAVILIYSMRDEEHNGWDD